MLVVQFRKVNRHFFSSQKVVQSGNGKNETFVPSDNLIQLNEKRIVIFFRVVYNLPQIVLLFLVVKIVARNKFNQRDVGLVSGKDYYSVNNRSQDPKRLVT